jgi:hypothetical protein
MSVFTQRSHGVGVGAAVKKRTQAVDRAWRRPTNTAAEPLGNLKKRTQWLVSEDIRLSTSLARWAIPADEYGRPKTHDWRSRKPAILSFQTAVGQRFEHLAAKRDWRVLQKRRLESRLAAKNGRPT